MAILTPDELAAIRRPYRAASLLPQRAYHDPEIHEFERREWFNGGLFDSAHVLMLTAAEIGLLVEVGRLDWSRIEPAIFVESSYSDANRDRRPASTAARRAPLD